MRVVAAAVVGLVTAAVCAVVLGDYPLSGAVPWAAAVVVPFLVGALMSVVAAKYQVPLWIATGPLSALAMLWGIRIASGWGLDPVPASAWAAVAIALAWPWLWALYLRHRPALTPPHRPSPAERTDAGD